MSRRSRRFKRRVSTLAAVAGIFVVAVGLMPTKGAVLPQPPLDYRPVASPTTGGTVAFDPSANPAFKVNGFTTCAAGRTGHVWVNAHILAVTVYNDATDELVVSFGSGAGKISISLNPDTNPPWEGDLTTSMNVMCEAVSGSSLLYVVRSYSNGTLQNTKSGNTYPISAVD